jgi:hypothetical protein
LAKLKHEARIQISALDLKVRDVCEPLLSVVSSKIVDKVLQGIEGLWFHRDHRVRVLEFGSNVVG